MTKINLIWSNYWDDIDVDEEFYKEEYPDIYAQGLDAMSEDMANMNYEYLDDERANLNIQLENPILILANLGLWNGRCSGYKIIHSGNIKDILCSDCDYVKWYCDAYNLKCEATHHDGTNYYEYREIRPNVNIDKLCEKLYNGEEISRAEINRYTKSLRPYIQKVYGWV